MRLSALSLVLLVVASLSSAAVAQKLPNQFTVDEWRDLFSRQPEQVDGACELGKKYNGINKSYFLVIEQMSNRNGAAWSYVVAEEVRKVCPDVW